MDIIESWVDENVVREMARQLTNPPSVDSEQTLPIEEEFVEDITVSSVKSCQSEQVSGQELPIPEASAKLLNLTAQKVKQAGVFVHGENPITGLDEEAGWRYPVSEANGNAKELKASSSLVSVTTFVQNTLQTKEICIFDRDGDVFLDTMLNTHWTNLTIELTSPIRKLDIQQGVEGYGHMHIKISARELLQIFVCSSSHGLFLIGAVVTTGVTSPQAKQLVQGIRALI